MIATFVRNTCSSGYGRLDHGPRGGRLSPASMAIISYNGFGKAGLRKGLQLRCSAGTGRTAVRPCDEMSGASSVLITPGKLYNMLTNRWVRDTRSKQRERMSMRKTFLALLLVASVTPALAQDKTVNLKVSLWVPPAHPLVPATQAWAAD